MKILMQDVINFNELYVNKLISLNLSLKVAYKIANLYNEISSKVDFYYQQVNFYLKDYAELDENNSYIIVNNNIKISENKKIEWEKKLKDLNNLEIILSRDYYFCIEDFENNNFSPRDILLMLPFIKEKEE